MENVNSPTLSILGIRRLNSSRVGNLNSSTISNIPLVPGNFRSSSGTVPQSRMGKSASVPPPPKPKFSPQEQLNILMRLKSGDFISNGGIQQFQSEKNILGTVCGTEGNAKDQYEEPKLPPLSSPSQPLPNFTEFLGVPEGNTYAAMPAHIKLFDKVMMLHIHAFQLLYNHATKSADTTFARIVKPKNIRALINRVVEVTHILQKFLKRSTWDKGHTFMPSKVKMRGAGHRRLYLRNAVTDQNKTRLAIIKASQVLEELRLVLKGGEPEDLDMKNERIRKLLDSWEGNQEESRRLTKKLEELFDMRSKVAEVEEDSDSESNSSNFDSFYACFEGDSDDNGETPPNHH